MTAVTAVFNCSAAVLGAVLAMLMGGAHFAFWSGAIWDGKRFVGGTRVRDAMRYANWILLPGALFLYLSLVNYGSNHRSLLDHALGMLTLFLVAVLISHKAEMFEVAEQRRSDEIEEAGASRSWLYCSRPLFR